MQPKLPLLKLKGISVGHLSETIRNIFQWFPPQAGRMHSSDTTIISPLGLLLYFMSTVVVFGTFFWFGTFVTQFAECSNTTVNPFLLLIWICEFICFLDANVRFPFLGLLISLFTIVMVFFFMGFKTLFTNSYTTTRMPLAHREFIDIQYKENGDHIQQW